MENVEEYTENQIERMRARLINIGAGGSFASCNTPTYWEAEQIIEEYNKLVKVEDRWQDL